MECWNRCCSAVLCYQTKWLIFWTLMIVTRKNRRKRKTRMDALPWAGVRMYLYREHLRYTRGVLFTGFGDVKVPTPPVTTRVSPIR